MDHPRACGENHIGTVAQGQAEGSPPRVRGKPAGSEMCSAWPRITPARAGKTYFVWQEDGSNEDHPRACGENLLPFVKS